jgi:hypothetical protein
MFVAIKPEVHTTATTAKHTSALLMTMQPLEKQRFAAHLLKGQTIPDFLRATQMTGVDSAFSINPVARQRGILSNPRVTHARLAPRHHHDSFRDTNLTNDQSTEFHCCQPDKSAHVSVRLLPATIAAFRMEDSGRLSASLRTQILTDEFPGSVSRPQTFDGATYQNRSGTVFFLQKTIL